MRVEGLTIALRERSPWEAVDLGVALVRAHAGRILPAWLLASGLLCALCIGIGYLLDLPWLGGLLLWWSKPLLDRIPLFVLSRVVMGEQPGFRAIWRAGWGWGWRELWPWLTWRRLHPGRCLLLAMDLLERPRGAARSQRARVLGALHGSPHSLLTIVGVHLETMLTFSFVVLLLMFVPTEFLDDTLKAAFDTLMEDPPVWLDAANALFYWLALAIFEPFYVGAGFALYLNRRTQVEGWDIELAFRRIAARLAAAPLLLVLVVGCALPGSAPQAAEAPQQAGQVVKRGALPAAMPRAADDATPIGIVVGPGEPVPAVQAAEVELDAADAAAFASAADTAMDDPLLSPRETHGSWKQRTPDAPSSGKAPPWLDVLVAFFALVFENILWLLVAVLALLLALNWRRLRRLWPAARSAPPPVDAAPVLLDAESPLPDDLPAAVQALWDAGQPRAALALLYRGALAWLATRLDQPLPPGTTEDDALRRARRLDPAQREPFAAVVRRWQAAAYAERLPTREQLVELLVVWRAASEAQP